MPSLRPTTTALLRTPTARLPLRRSYTQPPPPNPPPNPTPNEPSRTSAFYRTFASPLLKTFLGALFTYQVLYWGWLKLEVIEEKVQKQGEIMGLKEELKNAVVERRERAREVAEKGVGKVTEEGKRRGWWPW
ncbi:hypothetical protein BU26DRAFT_609888 [Trematosphaeria pertusa]|uniref:Uncharacterized protein n=1 Tax=Trematosphaeria pertusa TaxID=390896 RepID=A0A6A6HX06_9PLEO|nr:uncharacterized protein BU26DRAFT_609888 [Trematosphaeria pertusa]KAF2242551.1 hypothetical protein BU26DRAFT_609888 [Trematosphaeria pertusa]